jgi:hypothetical protein
MPSISSKLKTCALFALLTPLAALSATPPPDYFGPAQAAISQARALEAEDYAPVELARAERKLSDARAALSARKKKDAALLAQQAELEALVAQARARAGAARAQVSRKTEENARLRVELLGEGGAP